MFSPLPAMGNLILHVSVIWGGMTVLYCAFVVTEHGFYATSGQVCLMKKNVAAFCGLLYIQFQCKQRMENWMGLVIEYATVVIRGVKFSSAVGYNECVS